MQKRSRRKGRGSGFPCDQLQSMPGAGSCRPQEPGETAESFPTAPSPTPPAGGRRRCCPGPWWQRARGREHDGEALRLCGHTAPRALPGALPAPRGAFPRTCPRPGPWASLRPRGRVRLPNPGRAGGPPACRRPGPLPALPSAAATHSHRGRRRIARGVSHLIVETIPARVRGAGQGEREGSGGGETKQLY